MGFFENEYEYGSDDAVDKRLRYILRVDPYFEQNYRDRYNRGPRRAEIDQEYSIRSVRGDFYYIPNASREELDILHEKRRLKEQEERESRGYDSSDSSLGEALGGLASLLFTGLAAGAAYLYNKATEDDYYYEDDYYEDDDEDEYY